MQAIRSWAARLSLEIAAGVFIGLAVFVIYVCSVQSISFIYQGY